MLYFKNSELAYTYHVSVRTVRNWIEAAKQGKLDLDLHSQGNKTYVSNTSRNLSTIEQLVERGKKYRPHRAVKTVTPKPEFYQLFNDAQAYDIIRNLEIYHEIPRQYNYFDGGADSWDQYAKRLGKEDTSNVLKSTINLLDTNRAYIDDLLKDFDRVNIFDIGVGNALPVKNLITHLLSQDKLGRYVAIDISNEIIAIAKRNIHSWFGGKVSFEGYSHDISYDRFTNLIAPEYLHSDSEKTANLVLFLGGTPYNFREPKNSFRAIYDSMGINDFLIYSDKLDSANSRKYFDFNPESGANVLSTNHRLIFDLFNIHDSFYEVERGFDEEHQHRYIRVRLNVALNIKFEFEEGEKQLEFSKGETILLLRAGNSSSRDIINDFEECGLNTIHSSQTPDQEYILTISRIKRS